MSYRKPTFQQLLWAAFIAQRPKPDDPTLRYGGAGRSEDKLRHVRQNNGSEETNYG